MAMTPATTETEAQGLQGQLPNGMVRRWAYCGADVYSPEEEASDGNTHDRN
jgi:hypothetical protein